MSATVQAPGPVLVGVDGSRRNASAVVWATAEAGSSAAPLVLVHDTAGRTSDAAGRATVDRAVSLVARLDPGAQPVTEVLSAGPALGLIRTAGDYDRTSPGESTSMVVVGRRGAGGFTQLSLGSTARTLVHEPGPPTVVVPPGWSAQDVPATAPVVVDVTMAGDGQDGQGSWATPEEAEVGRERALSMALARAGRDGRPVLALLAWAVDASTAMEGRAIPDVWGEHAARAEQELEELLQAWRSVYPGVEIQGLTTDRHPVAALLEQASTAELVVVPRGSRGCAVVEYAACPVAVV